MSRLAQASPRMLVDRWQARLLFELAVALYFGVATRNHGISLDLAATLVFAVPLLLILLVDWWTGYIFTGVVLAGIVAALAFALAEGTTDLILSALAALGAGLIFAGAYWLAGILYGGESEEAPLGVGDIYLAVMIGAMARFPLVVTALFTGALVAAAAGVLLIVVRRRSRHDVMPYGAYLCLGALLTFLAERG